MSTRAAQPHRPRRAVSVVRGLLALVAIVVLLVGIPAALVAIAGPPLPDSMPSWADIRSALTSPGDGTVFLGALVVLAWLGWAGFAIGVLVEVPAAFRGRRAPQLPVVRFQQRAAAGLVTAVAALFVAGPVGVATAGTMPPDSAGQPSAPATSSSASATADPGPGTGTGARTDSGTGARTAANNAASPSAPAAPTRQHVVRSGESLWRIAEEQLGDGARWTEIAELNYGVEQPGGGALDRTHWLDPGWRLSLPAATGDQTGAAVPAADTSSPDTPAADSARSSTHIVAEGDTLWDIAEQRLGDGARYPELVEASRDTVQPDGRQLRDPDVILPGWKITVPGTGAPVSEPPAAQQPDDTRPQQPEQPAPEEPPAAEQNPPAEDEPPASEDTGAGDTDTENTGAGDTGAEERPPADDAVPDENDVPAGGDAEGEVGADADAATAASGDADFPVRTAAGVGSLLAAGVLAYLAAKRRGQQRRRRPGERIAKPTSAAAVAERDLRTVTDPMSVEHVDVALRELAVSCARRGVALPPLRVARLTSEQFELYLTEPASLPSPFVATDQEHVWFLPAGARAELDATEIAEVAAPYPSLVTVGHGPENGHLLLDLERLGTLAVTGPPERTRAVMAALAVELATSPWADDAQVTLVGTSPELADGLDTGRVRHLDAVDPLLDELAGRAEADRLALHRSGAASLDDARARGVAAAAWTPEIVLLAEPLTPEQHRRLDELVDTVPRVAVAAVTHEGSAGRDHDGWSLELSPTDADLATLLPVGVDLSPQRLDHEQYRRILGLLGIAEQPATAQRSAPPREHPRPGATTGTVQPDAGTSAFDNPAGAPLLADLPDGEEPEAPPTGAPPAAAPAGPADPADPAGPSAVPDVIDAGAVPVRTEPPSSDGPTIMLLGPVEVENAEGPVEQSKYRQLTEIAAYIALQPGLSHTALDEAIWPGSRVTQNTRNTAISKLRRWFGSDGAGADYVPRVDTGYRFHPAVSTDWDLWMHLVGANPVVAGTDQLLRALELVRGQPFTGVNPRRYAWAENIKQDMISAIVDAAHELARRGLEAGDAHLARKAATIGLQVEPGMEVLWRDRIKAEHMAGNRAGITDAVARVTAISDDLGDELEQATVNLINQVGLRASGDVAESTGAELSGQY
ncbi:LysM domain-containing protein [Haloactinopolyspora alba]|uniref:LysM domain-containing protein n=1 Tax=Haloactinopolyspora alba TaxID=648780 RepID=A0A2P8DVZ7_9ACTN|nr:LysM peptidoglycan-binding domain-containing protein [Haloactinopolyspora alba]PSL01385.1 LysM domain-containing protein [Haloactinopolyspora alba]